MTLIFFHECTVQFLRFGYLLHKHVRISSLGFITLKILCVQEAKALAKVCFCASPPEHSRLSERSSLKTL